MLETLNCGIPVTGAQLVELLHKTLAAVVCETRVRRIKLKPQICGLYSIAACR